MFIEIKGISGGGFHLPGDNMDTDRIIPAAHLMCVTFEGLGAHVFGSDREQLKGKHPFDDPNNKGRSILLVGENFGSGSSREHAVPALTQWGIRAIIGLSFAEIFRGNAVANGLVCVTVKKDVHEFIVRELSLGAFAVNIDLEAMTITTEHASESEPMPCEMSDAHRHKLVTGTWDDITTCLAAGDVIEETAARLPYFAEFPA